MAKAAAGKSPQTEPVHVSKDASTAPGNGEATQRFEFGQRPSDTLERPSTSGGSRKVPMRSKSEKRITRDDFDLGLLGARGTVEDWRILNCIPSPQSTPGATPGTASPPKRNLSLAGTHTPDSLEIMSPRMHISGMEIGMALGSPSQQPVNWPVYQAQDKRINSPSPEPSSSIDASLHAPMKKASRWKRLFGGRKNSAPAAFYQVQPEDESQAGVESSHPDGVIAGSPVDKKERLRGQGHTTSVRRRDQPRPDMKRSNTLPQDVQSHFSGEAAGQRIPILVAPEELNERPHGVDLGSGHAPRHGGLLDVDIPTVELERYSIMFNSVLQRQGNSTSKTSSLLARRQATLKQLKTADEELTIKEQELQAKSGKLLRPRRASSPQPGKSPGFSLFPNTPTRVTIKGGGSPPMTPSKSPLHRSNTSPAALSPSRPSFAPFAPGSDSDTHTTLLAPPPARQQIRPLKSNQPASLTVAPVPTASTKVQSTAPPIIATGSSRNVPSKGLPSHPSQFKQQKKQEFLTEAAQLTPKVEKVWEPNQSHLSLSSPGSDDFGEEGDEKVVTIVSSIPRFVEPSWEMVDNTPSKAAGQPLASSVSGSATSKSGHSASTSESSTSATSTSAASVVTSPTKKQMPVSVFSSARSRSATTSAIPKARYPSAEDKPEAMTGSASPDSQTKRQMEKQGPAVKNPSSRAVQPLTKSASTSSRIRPTPVNANVDTVKARSTTTRALSSSTSKISPDSSALVTHPEESESVEMRLTTAANVSIARQISVSRQQRQLLVPIRSPSSSGRRKPEDINTSLQRGIDSPNGSTEDLDSALPSPFNHTTSPLSLISTPKGLNGQLRKLSLASSLQSAPSPSESQSPSQLLRKPSLRPALTPSLSSNERLKNGTKPSTPTLVLVNDGRHENMSGIGTTTTITAGDRNGRRRGDAHKDQNSLTVTLGAEHTHRYKKSERVILEGGEAES